MINSQLLQLLARRSKLYIIGAGGLGTEVLGYLYDLIEYESIRNIPLLDLVSFAVDEKYFSCKKIKGHSVVKLSTIKEPDSIVIVAVGKSKAREEIVTRLPNQTIFPSLVHPNSSISRWIDIGIGNIVAPLSTITSNVTIGNFCILNPQICISHDSLLNDYINLSPGVKISGHCDIGDHVLIGTGATVSDRISICNQSIIGAGAVVVQNITQRGTYVGVPAKILNNSNEN